MPTPKFALLALLLLPTAQAADDPPKGKWIRNLRDGVTVELLGICDPATKEWWTPDGTALAEPIIDTFPADGNNPQRLPRVFAVRVHGDLNPTVAWDFEDFGGESGSALKNKEQLEEVLRAVVRLPQGLKTKTLRLKVAATRWVTKATYRYSYAPNVASKERNVAFSQPRETEKGVSMVVVDDYVGLDTQFLAFGKDGKSLSSTGSRDPRKTFCVHDQVFRVDKLEMIERFELQVRPIEAVEFVGVPLVAPKL